MNSKLNKGFTMVELVIGILVTGLTAGAIMYGVTLAKGNIRSVEIEEHAFNYLQGFTEEFKARIAAGRIPQLKTAHGTDCIEFGEYGNCITHGDTYYKIESVRTGKSQAKRFKLTTRLKWKNNYGKMQNLEFFMQQLVIVKG